MDFSQIQSKFSTSFIKSDQLLAQVLPFSGVPAGLLQGKLVEVTSRAGNGKTSLVLRFLKENPELQLAWIEMGANIYPCAFSERGVELDRVLFVEPEEVSDALWCAHQILKSQIFGAIVLSQLGFTPHTTQKHGPRNSCSLELRGQELGEIELRRLQIAAERSGTLVFLLNEELTGAGSWPITMQLRMEANQLQIHKDRSGINGKESVWQVSGIG
jgi:hypothetical protein